MLHRRAFSPWQDNRKKTNGSLISTGIEKKPAKNLVHYRRVHGSGNHPRLQQFPGFPVFGMLQFRARRGQKLLLGSPAPPPFCPLSTSQGRWGPWEVESGRIARQFAGAPLRNQKAAKYDACGGLRRLITAGEFLT